MEALLRSPVLLVPILAAVIGTVGVFTFAKPEHRRANESKTIDFSKVEHRSAAEVRRAFAANGVELRYRTNFSGFLTMSNVPPPWFASTLHVLVAPRDGKGSWGPELEQYDERFDNVLVTYGGRDDDLLRRVGAAVSDLR